MIKDIGDGFEYPEIRIAKSNKFEVDFYPYIQKILDKHEGEDYFYGHTINSHVKGNNSYSKLEIGNNNHLTIYESKLNDDNYIKLSFPQGHNNEDTLQMMADLVVGKMNGIIHHKKSYRAGDTDPSLKSIETQLGDLGEMSQYGIESYAMDYLSEHKIPFEIEGAKNGNQYKISAKVNEDNNYKTDYKEIKKETSILDKLKEKMKRPKP